ncbi:MAG: aspartate carbamoyltransferase, partial [Armatimonadetes bacterium]|nr:aspartate carbamoyltransferase [Armatimonadota bacterium]
MRQFVNLDGLDDQAIGRLLQLAKKYQDVRQLQVLSGKVVGLVFMNPSLRTLA